MFSMGLYYLFVVLLICNKHSRIIRYVAFLLLFCLFCFNSKIADRSNYEFLLTTMQSVQYSIEFCWGVFLFLASKLGLSVQGLYVVVGISYLVTLFYMMPKFSNNNNMSLACYMIGFFFLDVVQLRYSLSLIFVWFAFYFLIFKDGKKSLLLFVLFIFLATAFHASNVVFFFFLFTRLKNSKLVCFLTLCFGGGLVIFVKKIVFYVGGIFGLNDKVVQVSNVVSTSSHSFLITTIFDLCIFVVALLCLWYTKILEKKDKVCLGRSFNMAITSLIFIPLLNFSDDFRRQIFVVFFMLICVVYRYRVFCIDKLFPYIPVVVSVMFFVYSTFSGNSETVFFPLFENNLMINFLKDFI